MATLAAKLPIREGFSIALINRPRGYQDLLGQLPQGVTRSASADGEFDWIQYFVVKRQQLEADVESLKRGLKDGVQLWVS